MSKVTPLVLGHDTLLLCPMFMFETTVVQIQINTITLKNNQTFLIFKIAVQSFTRIHIYNEWLEGNRRMSCTHFLLNDVSVVWSD